MGTDRCTTLTLIRDGEKGEGEEKRREEEA
jgi:hypothetical protein